MAKMGRPRKEIDFDQLKKLCAIQCTELEIADFFDMTDDTLNSRIKEEYEITFSEYFKKNSSFGKISLRRNQFKMAEKSVAMAIWLGKQYLGQADHQELELQGGFTSLVDMVSKKTKVKEKPE